MAPRASARAYDRAFTYYGRSRRSGLRHVPVRARDVRTGNYAGAWKYQALVVAPDRQVGRVRELQDRLPELTRARLGLRSPSDRTARYPGGDCGGRWFVAWSLHRSINDESARWRSWGDIPRRARGLRHYWLARSDDAASAIATTTPTFRTRTSRTPHGNDRPARRPAAPRPRISARASTWGSSSHASVWRTGRVRRFRDRDAARRRGALTLRPRARRRLPARGDGAQRTVRRRPPPACSPATPPTRGPRATRSIDSSRKRTPRHLPYAIMATEAPTSRGSLAGCARGLMQLMPAVAE
jgi:hypothetical protein